MRPRQQELETLARLGDSVPVIASNPSFHLLAFSVETASSKYNVPFPHSGLSDNIHYQSAWVDKYNVNHYKHPAVYNVREFNTDWPNGFETDENVHLAGVMKAVRDGAEKYLLKRNVRQLPTISHQCLLCRALQPSPKKAITSAPTLASCRRLPTRIQSSSSLRTKTPKAIDSTVALVESSVTGR